MVGYANVPSFFFGLLICRYLNLNGQIDDKKHRMRNYNQREMFRFNNMKPTFIQTKAVHFWGACQEICGFAHSFLAFWHM